MNRYTKALLFAGLFAIHGCDTNVHQTSILKIPERTPPQKPQSPSPQIEIQIEDNSEVPSKPSKLSKTPKPT